MATPSDTIPVYLKINSLAPKPMDRRRRVRMQVHWPLRFLRSDLLEAVETVTSDLSSEGFYCLANTPFVPGELRVCTLGVPTNYPRSGERMLTVECKVRIVRAQLRDDGLYGVGCHIEDYRFVDIIPSDLERA